MATPKCANRSRLDRARTRRRPRYAALKNAAPISTSSAAIFKNVNVRCTHAAFLHPHVIHRGEHRDQRHRDRLRAARRQRDEVARIDRERDRQPRAPARQDRQHERPAAYERAQRSVGFPQIHVLPARGRKHRAQFGVGQRSEEREHAGNHPRRDDRGCTTARCARSHSGSTKMPEPITMPMTIAVASTIPSRRGRSRRSDRRRHVSYSPAPHGSARPCAFPPRPY